MWLRVAARELVPPICRRLVRRLGRRAQHSAGGPVSDSRPVLIYQMGKVGSQTVAKTVRGMAPHAEIHRHHMLTAFSWDAAEHWCRFYTLPPAYTAAALTQIHQCKLLRLRWESERQAAARPPRWRVISMTREPVAYAVSAMFEVIDTLLPGIAEWRQDVALARIDAFLARQVEIYCRDGRADRDAATEMMQFFFHWPLLWFEREFAEVLRHDVYTSAFPVSDGAWTGVTEDADFLLMRFENMFENLSQRLASFLGCCPVSVQSANMTASKPYAALHQAFKQRVSLPAAFLDRQYHSRYARHFYTDVERATFAATWSGQAAATRQGARA